MTGPGLQDDMDEAVIGDGAILLVGACLTACFLIVASAFLFKVYNERQMTHEYQRQADALERMAYAAESQGGTDYILLCKKWPQYGQAQWVQWLKRHGDCLELRP